MKHVMILLVAVGLVCIGSSTWAWNTEYSYEIPYIPDALIPEVDGVLNDAIWVNYPMEYAIVHPGGDIDLVSERIPGTPDASDYSVTIKWGWNATTNLIYIAIDEFDDAFNVDSPSEWWADDVWQLYTDAKGWNDWYQYNDAIAEEEWGAHAQQWEFTAGEHWWGTPASINVENPKGNKTVCEEPYAKVAFPTPPETGSKDVSFQYEIYLALWEYIDPTDQANSVRWNLAEGQTIGLALTRYEDDAGGSDLSAEWATVGKYEVQNSSTFSQAYLLAPGEVPITAVEPSSWGAIKALLR